MEASSSVQQGLPEHNIFLSHSGHDKPFVERLCEELKRVNHSPFFDQNSDSLPKGDRFPPHIFKAAEQCLLAVIVLSEGYLTSKWPMLELAAFVKAQETINPNLKLFPLFYKLSPSDLAKTKWIESWTKLAEDGKIQAEEIELWRQGVKVLMNAKDVETQKSNALIEQLGRGEIMPNEFSELLSEVVKELRPYNGLEFRNYGTSEGRYIHAVIDEICEIIPPMMKYNTDRIRGYQRLCEKTSSMFQKGSFTGNICKPGCFYLGLHGMGGVGKTTLCEAMCSFYQWKFRGRVCHVELQSDFAYQRIDRLKHVIRQLGSFDNRIVEKINSVSQGLQCLQNQLEGQPPVFLVVDNVGDSQESRDEARSFISAPYACGSKVMVTSRSWVILESLLEQAKYCKPIPRLEDHEAEELFLAVAIPRKLLSPLEPDEDRIVKACLKECKFVDDGYDTQQYHPLVLRALGTFFHDIDKDDIMGWKEALMVEKKLQESRDSKHVNDVLGLNYSTLSDTQKLIFLDVVFLFNDNDPSLRFARHLTRCWECEYEWEIQLIASMHGISSFNARMKVKELQRKSLIYESSPTLKTHDLYIEFAKSLIAEEGKKERNWWMGHWDSSKYNPLLKRLLLYEDASKICKAPKQLWECQILECLVIVNCNVLLKHKLDLKCFKNLRVLVIMLKDSKSVKTEIVCGCDDLCYGGMDYNKGCLLNLQYVRLFGFDVKNLPFLRHSWNLKFLTIDWCHFCPFDFTEGGFFIFENLKALEALSISCEWCSSFSFYLLNEILQGATKFKSLKELEINCMGYYGDVEGFGELNLSPLGLLTSLEVLSLPCLPICVKELKGLDQLLQLKVLNLKGCFELNQLPDLNLLPNLQEICVADCENLEDSRDQLSSFQQIHLEHECLIPIQVADSNSNSDSHSNSHSCSDSDTI